MTLTIVEERADRLGDYARVPIGFSVAEAFDERGIARLALGLSAAPIPVVPVYWKDYDAYSGNHPTEWPARFDVSRWLFLAGFLDARRVGGAVLIARDPQISLLQDCSTCALLWDLRVAPDVRGQGIGSALLRAAGHHVRQLGANILRVETQQVNVPACRFYQRRGFRLARATPGAYAELPNEVQLLWRKSLT